MSNNWNPFFALANTRSEIDKAIDSRLDIDMSDLTEDAMYEMQERIVESFKTGTEVCVTYYKNKRHNSIEGNITKIDQYQMCIYVNEVRIEFNTLLRVELI